MRGRMSRKNMLIRLASATCITLLTVMPVAAEKPRSNVGVLTCTLLKRAQETAEKMMCGFKPTGSGAEEKYSGVIHESGQGLPTGKVVLLWAVLATSGAKARPGMLAQRYLKAPNTPGTPPLLVGEKDPAIVLEFQTNDSSAPYDSISLIELELTGTPA